MQYRELLTEMIWEDRFEAAKIARRFPRGWIHFSDVNKLGVNPSKQHHDPPGIYFYPIRWLFSDAASLSQFATEYKYYFIVRFKPTSNIVNLGRMTMDDVTRIATANNWIDDLREVIQHPELLASHRQAADRKRIMRKPGGLFYATLDYLANIKKRPWLPMLKGCDGLYDPGNGIISVGEHAQAVVFGRQHITVVAQGDNTDHGDREYADILKQIATEMGGRFFFRNKLPVAEFANDGRPFRVTLKFWTSGGIEIAYYHKGFWMVSLEKYDTHAGDRANHYRSIKYHVTHAASEAEPAATPTYWNGETTAILLHSIMSSRTNQRVEEDGLHVWSSGAQFAGIYSFLNAVITHDDRITINAQLSLDHFEFKVTQTFEQQPIATVATAILDALAQQMIEKLPNPTALKSHTIGGFMIGNRLNAVA
jgi:hypothetical protein